MLFNILILLTFGLGSYFFFKYVLHQSQFNEACRKGELELNKLNDFDHLKAKTGLYSVTSFSMFLVIALLKQHYMGG